MMSEVKETIMGDKHVHEAGSIMLKFVQYNMGTQQGNRQETDEPVSEPDADEFAKCEEVAETAAELNSGNIQNAATDYSDAISKCFKFANDFVKSKVLQMVAMAYGGTAANLALIEVALFDHGFLKKRNNHTAFVRTLTAWGALDVKPEKVKDVANRIADKMKSLPAGGYLEWDTKQFCNERNVCEQIGALVKETMPYCRT